MSVHVRELTIQCIIGETYFTIDSAVSIGLAVCACIFDLVLCNIALFCIVLYLSISIALLTACAVQKLSRPQQLTLCRSLHAEALQATVSKGLAQGSSARARFEPTILRLKGIDSTNAPPRPTTL